MNLHSLQDICGRYTDLEFIPTAIECFHRKQSFHFADAASVVAQDLDLPIPHIAIGDSAGQISIIKLHVEFGLSTEVGMKKKNQLLFAQSVEVQLFLIQSCFRTAFFAPHIAHSEIF